MKLDQKAQFFTQLATMTRGGLPLSQAFGTLTEHFPDPVVREIQKSIESGDSVEIAFHREGFTAFEQSFISAGNQTGQLAASFAALADYWQRENDLAKAVRQSMRYPVFLLHVAVLLPPVHLIVDRGVGIYLLTVGVYLACLYGSYFFLRRFLQGLWSRPDGQTLLLRVPLIGPFWRSVYLLRWTQILRMEFEAGLGLPQAISDAWLGTGAAEGVERAPQAQRQLLDGESLSKLVERWALIPAVWKGYFAAAELSGQLSSTLDFLAGESEKDYQRRRQSLVEWLPKIFTFAVLLLVAGYIVNFYARYYQQVANIGQD